MAPHILARKVPYMWGYCSEMHKTAYQDRTGVLERCIGSERRCILPISNRYVGDTTLKRAAFPFD